MSLNILLSVCCFLFFCELFNRSDSIKKKDVSCLYFRLKKIDSQILRLSFEVCTFHHAFYTTEFHILFVTYGFFFQVQSKMIFTRKTKKRILFYR